jgi:hypothetical protein
MSRGQVACLLKTSEVLRNLRGLRLLLQSQFLQLLRRGPAVNIPARGGVKVPHHRLDGHRHAPRWPIGEWLLGEAIGQVLVSDGDFAEFAGADTSVSQDKDDGLVTVGGGAATMTYVFVWQDMPSGGLASGKHGLNIFSGVRLDGGFLRIRARNFLDDVMLDQVLFKRPGPERAQAGVVVEEGLFAEVVAGCQEGAHLISGDFDDDLTGVGDRMAWGFW